MVDVGVADHHQVRIEAGPFQVGIDRPFGRVRDPGVDQDRALGPGQGVLADEALAEVGLDPVDALRDLQAVDDTASRVACASS
jgi:hypothetical protein